MRVLITGITGFVGSHLAEYLFERGDVEVFGTYRWRSNLDNLYTLGDHLNLVEPHAVTIEAVQSRVDTEKINLIEADVIDASSMTRVVQAVRPDRIFHLAAQSFVPTSWTAPHETIYVNAIGQVNLLEAVRRAEIDPLIQVAGSSEEYGLVHEDETPIKETNPLRPLSPYAVSKVAQDKLAIQYFHSYGMRCIVTRAFNHSGPRQSRLFLSADYASQIAEIEKGKREPRLMVGDLTSRRDLTDVRDVVEAYWLVLERGQPGEVYNIGRGEAYTARFILEKLLSLSTAEVEVVPHPAKMRPSDVKLLVADASKFQAVTDWRPRLPLAKTLEDVLEYWRARA